MLVALSRVLLFDTPWVVACQAPLTMGFSRQEYWSGLPCPPPRDLPNPGTEPRSPTLQADSLPSEAPRTIFYQFHSFLTFWGQIGTYDLGQSSVSEERYKRLQNKITEFY